MTTKIDKFISQTEKLCEQATQGPWVLDDPLKPNDISIWAKNNEFLANLVEVDGSDGLKYSPAFDLQRVEDAQFIAAARTSLPLAMRLIKKYKNALEMSAHNAEHFVSTRVAKEALDYWPEP